MKNEVKTRGYIALSIRLVAGIAKNEQKFFAYAKEGEDKGRMTRKEAKNELKPIKDIEARIKTTELEIERLMAVATKMTPSYNADKPTNSYHNRIEEAIVKIEEYRGKLSRQVLRSLDYKNKCLAKIERIRPESLQKFLLLYYFQGKTIEQIAEIIDKTPRWTYELFCTALDEYAKEN